MNYLEEAVKLARNGIENQEGGPFGAVVVNPSGKIIGYGNNQVLKQKDPTAHAEIVAIRNACKNINSYDLTGCTIYTTSEPCPMCISAIIWSNIKEIYYGTNRKEVAKIGFRDDLIYNYLEGYKKDIIKVAKIENKDCNDLLNEYKDTIY